MQSRLFVLVVLLLSVGVVLCEKPIPSEYSIAELDGNERSLTSEGIQKGILTGNNTQSPINIYNGQFVSVASIQPGDWHYYMINLKPNSYLNIRHSAFYNSANLEIYLEHFSRPTQYNYYQKSRMYQTSYTISSQTKPYSHTVYVGVRNLNLVSSYYTEYSFSVSTTENSPPTPVPTPIIYRNDNSVSLSLGVPAILMCVCLIAIVVVQIRRINALQKRITELERKSTFSINTDETTPAVMNIPLMTANNLEQQHEEIQEEQTHNHANQPQPTATYIPRPVFVQQPTTTPHMFPQFVSQLPPQYRTQPYGIYPQVVSFPQQTVPQQQLPQQQTSEQTKQ